MTVGLKTTSVTEDVIDWPTPNKFIDCVTARQSYYFDYDKKWFYVKNLKCGSNYGYFNIRSSRDPRKKGNNPRLMTTALNPKLFEKVAYIKSIHIKGVISSS